MAFLASHRAAGHISGQCLSVDGGMEGRLIWKQPEASDVIKEKGSTINASPSPSVPHLTTDSPATVSSAPKRKVQIALSVDFDVRSGLLDTGKDEANHRADYSQGNFAAKIGVIRLINLFTTHGVADKVTWFLTRRSMETFPEAIKAIKHSGCEIALHAYSYEVRKMDYTQGPCSNAFLERVSNYRTARERRP